MLSLGTGYRGLDPNFLETRFEAMKTRLTTIGLGLVSAGTVLAIAAPAGAFTLINGNVTGNVTGGIVSYQCPTPNCVDLESGGYNVSGGGLVAPATNKAGSYKIPGTDIGVPDGFNDADKVLSYNLTSSKDDPLGAKSDIWVHDLAGSFDFFWGSVDSYNTLQLFDGNALVATYTGTHVATAAGRTPLSGNYHFDAYVAFTGDFTAAKLTSTQAAFEVATEDVPEPAAVLGLVTLGLLSAGLLPRFRSEI